MCDDHTEWVALAVVQSHNPRRKVPRSDISLPDLERCLSKASYSAAQNSGKTSVHWLGAFFKMITYDPSASSFSTHLNFICNSNFTL